MTAILAKSFPRAGFAPELWVGVALALFTVIIRAAWFGDHNADTDEQLYSLIGNAMLEGRLVFVDLWDRKPFGLFALFALAHAIGGPGPEAYQVMGGLFTFGGAWLTYRLARHMVNPSTAAGAGLLYIVLTAIYGAYSGNSEVFFIPMMLATAVLVRDPAHPRAVMRMLAAMLIGGAALQVKYTVLPQCVFFGLWGLWGQYRQGAAPVRLVLLAAVSAALGLLPTALVAAYYAALGHLDAFVFANFLSFFDRIPSGSGRLRQTIAVFLVPLAGLALGGINAARRSGRTGFSQTYVFSLLWLAASLASVFLPADIYRYYLAALVPATILVSLPLFAPSPPGTQINLPMLLLVALYLLLMPSQYAATQESRAATERLAGAIAPHIDPAAGRCLLVFDGPTSLYRLTNSCLPSRLVYPDHLNNALERKALGVSQEGEVARLLATRPPVIVTADRPFTPQNRDAKRLVDDAIARDYQAIAQETLDRRVITAWQLRR
ncbi:ArnT family glycosyltransferase [Erythrobacter sp. R86502]|uniref:ArnT family glycosyltransferase n=1 Tax=Erythrobacter sp. R86502 TaxID=3093846 RepID=UPI0036D2F5FA